MVMFTAEKILALRTSLGWTRTQLAAHLGVSESAVCRWEMGERHPKYDTMAKLNELEESPPSSYTHLAKAK